MEDRSFFEVESAEEVTPVQTRSYIDSYMRALLYDYYSDFLSQFKAKIQSEDFQEKPPTELNSLNFLNQLHQGYVNFCFCPDGIHLLEILPIFKKYRIKTKIYTSKRWESLNKTDLYALFQKIKTKKKWLVFNENSPLTNWNDSPPLNIPNQNCNLAEVLFFFAFQLYRGEQKKIITQSYSPGYIRTTTNIREQCFYIALTNELELRISLLPCDLLSFAPFGVLTTYLYCLNPCFNKDFLIIDIWNPRIKNIRKKKV